MSESDDRMELAARRKGYIRDGVYVKVEIDARVITEDLIKTWAPEDLEIIRDRIIKVINKDIKPSGDEKGGHRDAMTAAATTHTPGKTALETPEGIIWLNTTLMGETCGPCVHKGPDSKPVEGAWDKYCNDCKTARSNFKAPSGDGKGGVDSGPRISGDESSKGIPASETPEGLLHPDALGGDWLVDQPITNSINCVYQGTDTESSRINRECSCQQNPTHYCAIKNCPIKHSRSSGDGKGTEPRRVTPIAGSQEAPPETPEGKKYGCPKSIKKDNEWFCDLDGTRCHTACSWFFGWKTGVGLKSALPKTPESAELIAWCEEHGRETVKKIMFGHFDSKVSGFTLFFKCGARQWYRLPFILDPVFRRPSGDEQSGHGAQGEPAPPNHQTSFLGLETPASKSSEGRLCKRLNAIDDSRCERPEDDPIHDPSIAGSHVYDPLPPDDSIDTCCYICAVHPYAWLECKGTRGDGDCSKCTPCPIFKPRSPAAELGNGTGAQREAATPGLPTSAGHETPTPSVTAGDHEAIWWYGIHIPTLVKIKEVINSDEYLSKNIAAAEGLSLVNEIIDRYIKLPAAATGAAAVTPIVGSAPALAETAGDLKAKLAEMTKFRDNAVSHYNDKCEEVRDLQAKLAAEKKDREDAQFEGHRLRAQLAAAEPQCEWARGCPHRTSGANRLAKKEARIAQLEKELAEAQETKGKYRKELSALEASLAAAEKDNKFMHEVDQKRADFTKEQNARIASLEQKYTALEKDYNAAYEKLATAEKRECARGNDHDMEWAVVRIAALEAALRQRCDECPHDTDDNLCKHCLWYEYKHPSGDDFEKCYEEDRKTIESLLAQRDKLANEVNRLQTALDGAADLMIGGVEGPVESAITPGVYWTRAKSRTRNDLRKKHNLPEWLVYQMEWDGHHWSNKSGWTHITMEQFVADGWQLGPRVENEPKDEQYHEVN